MLVSFWGRLLLRIGSRGSLFLVQVEGQFNPQSRFVVLVVCFGTLDFADCLNYCELCFWLAGWGWYS